MAKVRKAVITAAGRGTRQYPASTAVQKEMFPLVDRDGLTKPMIQIIGEEAIDSGIEEICIITQPGEEKHYRDYFRRLDDERVKSFRGKDWAILESEKLGRSASGCTSPSSIRPKDSAMRSIRRGNSSGDEPFLLLLGDHVYISDMKDRCARQLIRVFEQYMLDAVTGVQPTVERQLHLFGTIRGSPIDANRGIYRAELIVEKPSIAAGPRATGDARPAGGKLPRPFRHARLLAADLRFAGIPDPRTTSREKRRNSAHGRPGTPAPADRQVLVRGRPRASDTTPASPTA